jgi:hypothetical protein
MRKLTWLLVVSAFCVGIVSAQSRPNFAGRWVLTSTVGPFGELGSRPLRFFNDASSSLGTDVTISQDAAKLTVEYAAQPNATVLTYRLDGAETRNVPPPAGDSEVVSTASWKDGKLVILSTQKEVSPQSQSITIQMTQTLSLTPDGTLVVESTHNGGSGKTQTTVYKRKQ